MKKILVGFFALALLLGFTGCGGDSDDDDDSLIIVTKNAIKVNGIEIVDSDDYDGEIDRFVASLKGNMFLNNAFTSPVCRISDGKLTINLGVPNATALFNLSTFSFIGSAYSVDSNALFITNFLHEDGHSINLTKKIDSTNEIMVILKYVDEATEIDNTMYDDVKLQQGWNIMLFDTTTNMFTNGTIDSGFEWVISS